MIHKFFHKVARWEYFYILLAALFGLYFVFRLPPLQVMDEAKHFQKAYAFSRGNFFCTEGEKKGQYGMYLPKEIAEAEKTFRVENLIYRADTRIPESTLNLGDTTRIGNSSEFVNQPFCTRTFWTILPQSIGIFVAHIFYSQIGALLYAGRLANLLFALIVMFFAIRITPYGKGIFAFTGLLPMFVQQISSVSADGVQYVLLLFFTALTLYYTSLPSPKKISRIQLFLYFLFSIFAVHAKAGYYPFVLLVFLVPTSIFSSKKSAWWYKIFFLFFHILFACMVFKMMQFNHQVIDQKSQFTVFLGNPLDFFLRTLASLNVYFDYYWKSLLGGLGTKEIYLSNLHYLLLFGGFFLLLKEKSGPFSKRTALTVLLLLLSTVTTIFLGIFILEPSSSPVNNMVQGKYFLPLLPLALLFLQKAEIKKYLRYTALVAICIASMVITVRLIEHRYYAVTEVPPTYTGSLISKSLTKQVSLEQTFVAEKDNLSGIGFLIAKDNASSSVSYQFVLKDAKCGKVLSASPLINERIVAGHFYEMNFPVIPYSSHQSYCFEIFPLTSSISPLRVNASTYDYYSSGSLLIQRTAEDSDLIFYSLYQK